MINESKTPDPIKLLDTYVYIIQGAANEALAMQNVQTDWTDIQQVLIEYFADKKDLSTLS